MPKQSNTTVAPRRESLPANVQEMLNKQKQAVMDKIGKPSTTSIQIKQNKTFVLPSGEVTEGPIEVVILDFVSMNAFYEGSYDKDNITPPLCFAIGDEPDNLIPSANAQDVQATSCAACPMNKYETAAVGRGKACKNTRVLAVMPVDADVDSPIWLLKVSPTGLKSYDGYVRALAQRSDCVPVQVVTKVGFDPSSDYPSLRFAPERFLDPEELSSFMNRMEEAAELIRTEPSYEYEEAQKPKAPARKPAARKPAGRR